MDQKTQIKNSINIVDLIGSYIELKKAGHNYKANCPFHGEKTASFMVSAELQIYKCFGCGKAGDIFNFIQDIEGVDFIAAMEILAEKAGITLEKRRFDPNADKKKKIYELNKEATSFYQYLLKKHKAGKKGLEYVKKVRKIDDETIKLFKVGFAPDTWDSLYQYLNKKGYSDEDIEMAGLITKSKRGNYIDKFRNRVMFPLIDIDNSIVGFTGRALDDAKPKYLNTPETVVFHKSMYLYGIHTAKIDIKQNGAIFVEGQMDVVSANQGGITNVVASSGTSLTSGQLKIIKRYTNEIIFCFDSDSAGMSATLRAIDLAEKLDFEIKVAIIPDKYDDLDDLIKQDKVKAKTIVTDTITIYDFFIASSLKKYDKKSPYGKKKILAELQSKLNKIKSSVVLEHYIDMLSLELSLEKNVIVELLSNDNLTTEIDKKPQINKEISKDELSTEDYILAILFNSKLAIVQNILYKLGKKDFQNEINKNLFTDFKNYIKPRKRGFKTKNFIKKLNSEPLIEKATDLYMRDLGDLPEKQNLLEKELRTTLRRLKRYTINRELKLLQNQIKEAEFAKDTELLADLAQKVYKISRLKVKYE